MADSPQVAELASEQRGPDGGARPDASPADGVAYSAQAVRRPKLLDQLREALRSRHYSRGTEQTYSHWVKRLIHLHNVRLPAEMAEARHRRRERPLEVTQPTLPLEAVDSEVKHSLISAPICAG